MPKKIGFIGMTPGQKVCDACSYWDWSCLTLGILKDFIFVKKIIIDKTQQKNIISI